MVVPRSAPATLRAEIDNLLDAPSQQRTTWAALIQSLQNGETLYARNAARLMMPASNMKIVTAAAAAEKLGWDHRFSTKIVAAAPLRDGVLNGDLIVIGAGDPTITPATLNAWAEQLWNLGLRKIEGSIIGDDNAFDDEGLGAGWAWDYLADAYAAPTGALEFNESAVVLSIQPGAASGGAVVVTATPPGHSLTIVNRLTTGAPDSSIDAGVRRLPGSTTVEIFGSVPAGASGLARTISVDNPTDFLVGALRHALLARGITVSGDALDIDAVVARPKEGRTELFAHPSPTLLEIATTMMKRSQNLYADTLFKALGSGSARGTAAAARVVVRDVLARWGVPQDNYVMFDGSGLSRYNYVTAEMLVRILRTMTESPKHAAFASTLPIAGRDGTLSRRLRGTRAEGNARAKTGSISNVRTLSGYVTTADGETLVFAILANHFNVPQSEIDAITDRIVERLAGFSRR